MSLEKEPIGSNRIRATSNNPGYCYNTKKYFRSLISSEPIVPIKRKNEKVGRNDLCPCGSGLKYKRCCYEQD